MRLMDAFVRLVVVVCALLCGYGAMTVSATGLDMQLGRTSHALLWSNEAYVKNGDRGRTIYEVLSSPSDIGEMVSGIMNPESHNDLLDNESLAVRRPRVVLAVVGTHLSSAGIKESAGALEGLVKSATSWLYIPYIAHESVFKPFLVTEQTVAESLLDTFGQANSEDASKVNKVFEVGHCSTSQQNPEDTTDVISLASEKMNGLSETDDSTQLILVCLANTGMEQAEEFAKVAMLDQTLGSVGVPYVVLYMSEPTPPTSEQSAQRRLLQTGLFDNLLGNAPDPSPPPSSSSSTSAGTYDKLFYLQADLLKALIIVCFSLIACLAGLCCLLSLDTPTKFESNKEHVN